MLSKIVDNETGSSSQSSQSSISMLGEEMFSQAVSQTEVQSDCSIVIKNATRLYWKVTMELSGIHVQHGIPTVRYK